MGVKSRFACVFELFFLVASVRAPSPKTVKNNQRCEKKAPPQEAKKVLFGTPSLGILFSHRLVRSKGPVLKPKMGQNKAPKAVYRY